MDDRCTVLVNSCDKYEEAWLPFFALLKKHWRECDFNLVLNTEKKTFHNTFGVITNNSNNNSWGGRLYECLCQIETPFVLCMLEDFFIQNDVLHNEFMNCLESMIADETIGAFYFNKIHGFSTLSEKYPGFIEMKWEESNDSIGIDGTKSSPTNPLYMFNCQAGLWRRDVLKESCKNCSSPWEFEEHGYEKADKYTHEFQYYCSSTTHYDKIREGDVFSYLLIRSTGYGIWQSKWLWNNKRLFREEGIPCECKTLPTLSKKKYYFDYYAGAITGKIKNLLGWK